MRNWFFTTVCFLTIVAFNGISAFAQTGKFDLEQTERILSAEIQRALKDSGGASISIALVKEDQVISTAAFGYSNMRTKSRATTGTFYSTASTFKPVTATAIMQLAEQGKIKLDDPVYKYLDETMIKNWGKREKTVTFRHILSHRSGFAPDVIGQNHVNVWGRGRKSLKTLEEIASDLHSIRAPEEIYEYNNLAFATLGLLIEKITGTGYEEYIVNNILKPIGVATTNLVSPTPEMVEMMAFPYVRVEDGSLKPAEQIQYSLYPCGDIYLTAQDMARFIGAHLNGGVFQDNRILSEHSVKLMHTAQFGGTCGLGFDIYQDDKGHTILSHTGATDNGYSSIMLCDLDSRVGAYLMSNFSGGNNTLDLGLVIKLLRGDYVPPEKRKTISLDANLLERYVGEYQIENILIAVIRKGDKLLIKTPFTPAPYQLYAESETEFFAKDQNYTTDITFVINDRNVVQGMMIDWQLRKIPLQKIK